MRQKLGILWGGVRGVPWSLHQLGAQEPHSLNPAPGKKIKFIYSCQFSSIHVNNLYSALTINPVQTTLPENILYSASNQTWSLLIISDKALISWLYNPFYLGYSTFLQVSRVGFELPRQREFCYQTTALPPTHHGRITQSLIIICLVFALNYYTFFAKHW